MKDGPNVCGRLRISELYQKYIKKNLLPKTKPPDSNGEISCNIDKLFFVLFDQLKPALISVFLWTFVFQISKPSWFEYFEGVRNVKSNQRFFIAKLNDFCTKLWASFGHVKSYLLTI